MAGTTFLASFANGSSYGIIQTKFMENNSSLFWDLYAKLYDTLTHLKPYQDLHNNVLNALELKGGERILDAGCGTGNF